MDEYNQNQALEDAPQRSQDEGRESPPNQDADRPFSPYQKDGGQASRPEDQAQSSPEPKPQPPYYQHPAPGQPAAWQDQPPRQNPNENYYYYGQTPPPEQGRGYQPKPPVNNMAVTSMVLGLVSVLISCCCFPIGFILGFALGMGGLVLAILSKKGQPFSPYAIAGLILSILGICESLFFFGCYLLTSYMMRDPRYSALFKEILEQYYNGTK